MLDSVSEFIACLVKLSSLEISIFMLVSTTTALVLLLKQEDCRLAWQDSLKKYRKARRDAKTSMLLITDR